MQGRRGLPDEVRRLARRQSGVISSRQLLEHVSAKVRHRHIAEGTLVPLGRGIHRLDRGPMDPAGQAWAGYLIAGPAAAIGGWYALHLRGLEVRKWDLEGLVEVWVAGGRKVSRGARWRFRQDYLGRVDRARPMSRFRGLPVIPAACAVLDVAERLKPQRATGVVLDVLRGHSSAVDLRTELGRGSHRHSALLAEVCADAESGVHSNLELRYQRDVERAHRLPIPDRQVELLVGRVDAWYVEQSVGVELDGRRFHQNGARDARRDNGNAVAGILTLRYGWSDVVGDPCYVARQVAEVLQGQGWSGTVQRCPRCPPY